MCMKISKTAIGCLFNELLRKLDKNQITFRRRKELKLLLLKINLAPLISVNVKPPGSLAFWLRETWHFCSKANTYVCKPHELKT